MEVKVYTTRTCPYCVLAKDFLKQNGVKFTEIDVSEDRAAAQKIIDVTGQMGVPVIEIGEEFVIGFDRTRLKQLLKL